MNNAIPIRYGEFYDVPRQIEFHFGGKWYFIRSYFEEEPDDYSEFYDVYLLPVHSEAELRSDPTYWIKLEGAVHLGRIPVSEIGLDPTLRKSIDGERFERWLAGRDR